MFFKYEYEILQPKNRTEYKFMPWKIAKNKFNIKDYMSVYKGIIMGKNDIYAVLNSLFHKFNLEHPEDFKGHSLSVSDIVVINGKPFYCDSFGWQNLSSLYGEKI